MLYLDATHTGASKEEIFRRLKAGEEINLPSYEQMLALMSECTDINLATFNAEGRKDLTTFYEETQREAILCREEATGRAVRFARSVKILISNPETGRIWLEVGRGSASQQAVLKERDYTLSETLHFGESVLHGAVRCIRAEVDLIASLLTQGELTSDVGLGFEDRHVSSAYPGVVSIVWNYYVHWYTTKLCDVTMGRDYLFNDSGVYILLRSFPGSAAPACTTTLPSVCLR